LEQQGNLESLHCELLICEILKESGPMISQGEFCHIVFEEIRGGVFKLWGLEGGEVGVASQLPEP
jgi:hypothetical protein